jgi:hypothetical protein
LKMNKKKDTTTVDDKETTTKTHLESFKWMNEDNCWVKITYWRFWKDIESITWD